MRFFRHWVRVEEDIDVGQKKWTAVRYGGSNESVADAAANARRLAKKLAEQFRRGEFPDSYGYTDRALREEVVDTIGDLKDPTAVVSRNAYGSLVLNTARVLFADIDVPRKVGGGSLIKGLMGALFGKGEPAPAEASYPATIVAAIERDPSLGMRVYRTSAGYRCLVASRLFDSQSNESEQLLAALGSDPLYKRLCRVQECFRARLTPKFWRCGASRPPHRFPWADASQEARMRQWEAAYRGYCQGYAVCELVDAVGSADVHPEAAAIVRLHDEMTCREGLPLA